MHNQWNILYADSDYPEHSNYRVRAALFYEFLNLVPSGSRRQFLERLLENAEWRVTPHPSSGLWTRSSAYVTHLMLTPLFPICMVVTSVALATSFSIRAIKRKYD